MPEVEGLISWDAPYEEEKVSYVVVPNALIQNNAFLWNASSA
jgi:hypothetical protein